MLLPLTSRALSHGRGEGVGVQQSTMGNLLGNVDQPIDFISQECNLDVSFAPGFLARSVYQAERRVENIPRKERKGRRD